MLEDIGILTGGEVITEEMGLKLENTQVDQLGKARRVVVSGHDDDHRRRRRVRSDQGPHQADQAGDRDDRLRLRPREAAGAAGQAGRRRRGRQGRCGDRDRDEGEEAPRRGRPAGDPRGARGGIVPGGGVALLNAQDAISLDGYEDDDERTGASIIQRSLEAPIRQIAENSGFEASVVVEKVRGLKPGEGLNADTGDYGDLVADGVIDPTMVTRSALQNAASIAKNILTTEAHRRRAAREGAGGMPGGGMPDMGGMM